jgi:flagellar motor switch protein FliG
MPEPLDNLEEPTDLALDNVDNGTTNLSVSSASAAAILLLLLDDDEAAAIVRSLAPDQIKLVSKAMFAAAGASEAEVDCALDIFVAQSRSVPSLSIGAGPRICSLVKDAVGAVRGGDILSDIAPQADVNALEILRWMDISLVARIIREEHPQVGALILSALDPEMASKAIADLNEAEQSDLLCRAAQLSSISAEALADLEALLQSYDQTREGSPKTSLGGVGETVKIVKAMSKDRGSRILKSVKKRDKSLGQIIEDEMFIFDNLIDLDAKALGNVLRTVDTAILTLALKGAGKALVDKALSSMSARAASSIRDDMAERGPTKKAEVEDAQKSIIQIVRQLADDGVIALGGKGDDYV